MRTTTKLIISNSLITFLIVLTFALFSLNRFYAEDLRAEQANLEKCIATFWELCKNKGTGFRLVDGQMMVGGHVLNGDFELTDTVQKIFGGVATVFMGDVRVTTNVLDDEGKRAVGTRLVGPAYTAVFKEGRPYRGETLILGHPYLTAYDPVRDGSGKIIGALFVGVKKSTFLDKVNKIRYPVTALLVVLLASLAVATVLLLKITRRLESSEANSLSFLETLMETIPSPIFYKDASGRYLGCNRAYESYTGITKEQFTGKTVFDIWPRDLAQQYHAQDQVLFEKPGTQMYEGVSPISDGTRRNVIFYKATFYSESGSVAGLVGVILDITERKAAEEEIRSAYQQLHAIVEFLPDATFVVDKEKRVIAWNLAIEKMTGIGKEEILGHGDYAYAIPFYGKRRPILIDLLDEDTQPSGQLYPFIRRVGRTLFTETVLPELNGREGRCIWGTAAPLFDKQGNRVGGIESMRDITEYKRVEAELRLRNILLSTQHESAIDGILAVDEHGRIISWNRRFLDIMNIPRSLLEAGYDEHVLKAAMERAADPQGFLEGVLHIYRHPGDTSRDEVALKDGIIVDRYSAPMVDAEGKYYGRVWYFRDITEQKHAEEIRLHFEAQRHHSQMMASFITRFGHDLKTPLTPLFTLMPLIKTRTTDANMIRMIDICSQSVVTIHELTEKALKLVKLSASINGVLEHVNLVDAVNGYIDENRDLLEQKDIICDIRDIDPGIVAVVIPDQLRELFHNLISNAARYSQPGGVIAISARLRGDAIHVAVHDDGAGIDPADLENIFDEFFKADESRHDVCSPGLGLAICKRIIANHHGSIRAESQGKGHGMTVHFTLPLE